VRASSRTALTRFCIFLLLFVERCLPRSAAKRHERSDQLLHDSISEMMMMMMITWPCLVIVIMYNYNCVDDDNADDNDDDDNEGKNHDKST
jgi:hypothetical protein